MAEVYIAKQGAIVEYNGRPTVIKKGRTRVEVGHELLDRFPNLFEPAADGAEFRVTTARAEPELPPVPTTPAATKRGSRSKTKGVQADQTPPTPAADPAVPDGAADGQDAPAGDGSDESTPEGQEPADGAPTPQDEGAQDVTPAADGETKPEGE